jgi:hypothetical protein
MMKRQRHILALSGMLALMFVLAQAAHAMRASTVHTPGTAGGSVAFSSAAANAPSEDAIRKKFDGRCKLVKQCGDLSYIDCGSAYDGPSYFVKTATLETVMRCGGACQRPVSMQKDDQVCTQCPPKAWTCGDTNQPSEDSK